MKFFCISDNIDTEIGMRLSGIEGVVLHRKEEVENTLDNIVNNKDVAVVLITEKLSELCAEKIHKFKLNNKTPLLVTIPDRHSKFNISETIKKYIEESIGIKI